MDQIKKYAPFGAVVCAILVIAMGFLTGVKCIGYIDYFELKDYSLFEVTFGGKMEVWGDTVNVIGFSFVNLLPFLFAVAGAGIAFLTTTGKLPKIAALGGAVLFVVAGILFLSVLDNAQMGSFFYDTFEAAYRTAYWNGVLTYYDLGIGAVFAAILSFVGAGCAAAPFVLEQMGK